MPNSSSITAKDLVPDLVLASHQFPDWEAGMEGEHGFGPAELIEHLSRLGEILGEFTGALGSAAAIIKHMQQLYLWVRGATAPKATPDFTGRERILVLLFDAYVTEGGGRTIPQLAARSGVSPGDVKAHLANFERMHLVDTLPDGGWCYRPA
jgi:hypothetical protein